ncbi:hypothetical protein O1611_g5765 [Lasiodiplodia mahajangana]|uniref:Uncharacterized protein n=1 Tax=Lasiodiplodia mahajangana TaxID=1108764 RepID=A0ACC2JKQ8_9PEZI|nr:hypothetical protein O1611_g5765 [Lasiodiplodia mahajangana]
MRAAVSVDRLTRLSVVVSRGNSIGISNSGTRSPGSGSGSAAGTGTPRSHPTIRATLESGRGPHKSLLASTGQGEFREVGLGLRTTECDVDPLAVQSRGGLWLVIEQTGSASLDEGSLRVELYSDRKVVVGNWEPVYE